jgi:hypothetical protein
MPIASSQLEGLLRLGARLAGGAVMSIHSRVRAGRQKEAEHHMKRSGHGGDKAQDAKMVAKGVHEHEDHLHGGKRTKLKLRHGGAVQGKAPKHRLDKKPRGGREHHADGNAIGWDQNSDPLVQATRKYGPKVINAAKSAVGAVADKVSDWMSPSTSSSQAQPASSSSDQSKKSGGRINRKDGGQMAYPSDGAATPAPQTGDDEARRNGGRARRADGGRVGKGRVVVNVITQGNTDAEKQLAAQKGMQAGMQMGARAAAARMAPGAGQPPAPAPMPPPGAAGPGPGMAAAGPGAGGPPPMMPPRKDGGRLDAPPYPHPDAGGGGGAGRAEKERAYADGGRLHEAAHSRRGLNTAHFRGHQRDLARTKDVTKP